MDHQVIGAAIAVVLVGLLEWRRERKKRKADNESFAVVTLVPPLLLTHDESAGRGRDAGETASD